MSLGGVAAVRAAAVALALAAPAAALAQSAAPQPRVAYPNHSAQINQIRATPDLLRVVSIAQDKTLRVWRLSDLALLRTIHLPSDAGEEGAPRSLAITADGREVFVGGWTGIAWHRKGQIYRFDLMTGRLLDVLRGFESSIEALAISRDGARLAIGLADGPGLRVLDIASGKLLFQDREYGERVMFVDYAVDGKLASTSYDGCVRIYSDTGQLKFRAEYPPRPQPEQAVQCRGSNLGGIRFSPDGRRLAFGVQDRPEVVLMDGASLAPIKVVDPKDPRQRSLCCVAWSPDSATLYVNGTYDDDGPTPLYRIGDAGTGALHRMDIGRQKFTNMLPLRNGDLVFATNVPSLARVAADGRLLAETVPPNGDFRFAWDRLRLSADGSRIALPMRADGSELRYFGIGEDPERAYRAADAADLVDLQPPLRDGGRVAVTAVLGDLGYKHPTQVGGRRLALQPVQSVWSWASHATLPLAALGTDWSVLLVDQQARKRWEVGLPAPAHQVAISADGRWVVAAVGDGTVRWFATDTGAETLGLFLHGNGADWVAWGADGYYASSPNGDQFIGWLVNRGDAQAPDFFRAVQFERTLYQPTLVASALRHDRGAVRGAATVPLAESLRDLAPPRVTIEEAALRDADGGRPTLELRFSAEATGRPVREVGVY
ncbi:MAG TPA: hypothetical protein VM491_24685, partial [Burkholderiaceae bacterium]|nr:hypothetical protein [Burkholderiaceae bacterium]